jgi:hypothetical protein
MKKKNNANTEKAQRERKPPKASPRIDKKYFILGILATIVFVVGVSALILVYYGEPTVARVNGINISAADVRDQMMLAEDIVAWEFRGMFPGEWDVDFEREQRPGVTFARASREEGARLAAIVKLMEEYANRHNIPLLGNDIHSIAHSVTLFALDDPAVFAEFAPYMPEDAAEGEEELLAAKHILAGFANFDTREEATEYATEILARVHAGEDFDMLMNTYSQDFGGLASHPDGYTFVPGVMVAEFEQATRELAVGEISGLVETFHGYHIILRIEPDLDNVMRPQTQDMTLEERMFQAVFQVFEARVEDSDLEFRRALNNVPVGANQPAMDFGW